MHEPWDIEIAFYINHRGIDPDKARTFTIIRWMWLGDLRPLEAAIVERHSLDQAVLNLLADMISGDASRFGKPPPYRLRTTTLRKGRRKRPEHGARNIVAALAYEHEDGKSDEVFERIGRAIGKTDRTVRQAVTAWRKQSAN